MLHQGTADLLGIEKGDDIFLTIPKVDEFLAHIERMSKENDEEDEDFEEGEEENVKDPQSSE